MIRRASNAGTKLRSGPAMTAAIVRQIRNRGLRIAVIGCGYVGLSTAVLFAEVGYRVLGVDINARIVQQVADGVCPMEEPGLPKMLLRNIRSGRLKLELASKEALSGKQVFVIAVQTPIDRNKEPVLTHLMSAIAEVGEVMEKGALVLVCSTVPPRTMIERVMPKLESISGLKMDDGFYLAYAPERIAPGNTMEELVHGPRLVGGTTRESTEIAARLLRTVCRRVIETDATVAEVAKLAENTFRDLNIAFANYLALVCENLGIDAIEAMRLANTHPRVDIHRPGPGVGGPCLPKDPYLLPQLSKKNLVQTARRLNDYMPEHVFELVCRGLKEANKKIENSKVVVLGSAYKRNVDDSRLSPSRRVIRRLLSSDAKVAIYDPHCKEDFGARRENSLSDAVKDADCVLIMVGHTEFETIRLKEVRQLMKASPLMVDGARIINPCGARRAGFRYLGIGLGARKAA